jgi:A/G-specific adenine glycosylase
MLQQTQVETVREYFLRWMERFPNLQTLAAASEEEVMSMWQGLGYYTRARNLHQAAQSLLRFPVFPEDPRELRRLPGIGEYTAHAVAAFAFDRCVPVVDANIARVLSRVFNYLQPIDTPSGIRSLRKMASSLLPDQGGGRQHTSALMDLGALLCKPRHPLCEKCPLHSQCLTQDPEAQPIKRSKRPTKNMVENRAFVCNGQFIWLSRSVGKWWKGLWTLPELVQLPQRPFNHSIKFSVTHHRVVMRIWKESHAVVAAAANLQKIALKDLENIAMPVPHRRGVADMLTIFHSTTS